MRTIILDKLQSLEQEFDVNILLACESDSRAWGFASPNSSYNVRFLYVHKKDFYLSIDERRDVLEVPIDEVFNIAGWELKKTLRLSGHQIHPCTSGCNRPWYIVPIRTFCRRYKPSCQCTTHRARPCCTTCIWPRACWRKT